MMLSWLRLFAFSKNEDPEGKFCSGGFLAGFLPSRLRDSIVRLNLVSQRMPPKLPSSSVMRRNGLHILQNQRRFLRFSRIRKIILVALLCVRTHVLAFSLQKNPKLEIPETKGYVMIAKHRLPVSIQVAHLSLVP